jgi:hypothetical protein
MEWNDDRKGYHFGKRNRFAGAIGVQCRAGFGTARE